MSSTSIEKRRLRVQTIIEVSVLTVCMTAVLIVVLIDATRHALRAVTSK